MDEQVFLHLPQGPALLRLTLGTALFDAHPYTSYAFAFSLLRGEEKLSHLEHLTLDFIKILPGPSAVDVNYNGRALDKQWTRLTSFKAYIQSGFKELISVGEKNGVIVDGTAVEALGVEEAYYTQRKIITARLRKTGKTGGGWLTLSEADSDYEPLKRRAESDGAMAAVKAWLPSTGRGRRNVGLVE